MCLFTFDPIDYSNFDEIPYKSLNKKAEYVKDNNFIILNKDLIEKLEIKINNDDSKNIIIEQILDFILLHNTTKNNNVQYNNFISFCRFIGYSLNYSDDNFFYKIK